VGVLYIYDSLDRLIHSKHEVQMKICENTLSILSLLGLCSAIIIGLAIFVVAFILALPFMAAICLFSKFVD